MSSYYQALSAFVFLTFCRLCSCASINGPITEKTSALMYMYKYGYINPKASNPMTGALISGDSVRKAILKFQAFANLEMTGKLDNETLTMMSMKRCGNKDFVGYGDARRKKRYALQGSRWRVRSLTYRITKYPNNDLSKGEVNADVARAFKVWSEVTNLTFSVAKAGEKIHIEIRFEYGEHGDGDPFDGSGGTLAHAYFPIYGGDTHFDAAEDWTVRSYRGTNLFQVAVHEIGHSLGLSHSDVRSALMAPFYRGYQPNFKLHSDDIQAIQSLYGKKKKGSTPKKPDKPDDEKDKIPTDADQSILCRDPKIKIDAITKMGETDVFVFKGEDYWKLTEVSYAKGYPRKIAKDFDGLPKDIDAAFWWKSKSRTYIFKGSNYWRMTDMVVDKDYPKPISSGFAGIPNNIQAAFVWSGNGKIYFFKGKHYWRFDPTTRPPVGGNYPKNISNWDGLPNNMDAALQYTNGYTYFFKDGQYWRFNDRAFTVDSADPKFPRRTGGWWFGCDKGQLTDGEERKAPVDPVVGADDVSGASDAVSGRDLTVDTSGST